MSFKTTRFPAPTNLKDDYSHVVLFGYKPATVKPSKAGGVFITCEPLVRTAKDDLVQLRAINKAELRAAVESQYPNATFTKGKALTQREQDLANLAAVREASRHISTEEIETAKLRLQRAMAAGKITTASTPAEILEVGRREGIAARVMEIISSEGDEAFQQKVEAETNRLASQMNKQEYEIAVMQVLTRMENIPEYGWKDFLLQYKDLLSYGQIADSNENFYIFLEALKTIGVLLPSEAQANVLLRHLVGNNHLYMTNGVKRSTSLFGGGTVKPFTGYPRAATSPVSPETVQQCVKLLIERFGPCEPTAEKLIAVGVPADKVDVMMQALSLRFGGNNRAAASQDAHIKTAAEIRADLNAARVERDKGMTTAEKMRRAHRQ